MFRNHKLGLMLAAAIALNVFTVGVYAQDPAPPPEQEKIEPDIPGPANINDHCGLLKDEEAEGDKKTTADSARLPFEFDAQKEAGHEDFGDLEDTEWSAASLPDKWVTTYRFETGGILAYRNRGGSYRNGTWRRDGDKLYIETNNKYCEYELTLTADRDVVRGTAHNVTGKVWEVTLLRYQKPE